MLKAYKKSFVHSYAFGAFAVYELLSARPENIISVYVRTNYTDIEKLSKTCAEKNIELLLNDRIFDRVIQKENSLVFAVFSKYNNILNKHSPHICLVNPSDMGNLGCIIRTAAAFGVGNIAVVTPAADIFDPRTIRASMGAIFRVNIQLFDSFEKYAGLFSKRNYYPFKTDGICELGTDKIDINNPYTLIFGNESAGLPASFAEIGTSVRIPQTNMVDSLNLSVSVGIALYELS